MLRNLRTSNDSHLAKTQTDFEHRKLASKLYRSRNKPFQCIQFQCRPADKCLQWDVSTFAHRTHTQPSGAAYQHNVKMCAIVAGVEKAHTSAAICDVEENCVFTSCTHCTENPSTYFCDSLALGLSLSLSLSLSFSLSFRSIPMKISYTVAEYRCFAPPRKMQS